MQLHCLVSSPVKLSAVGFVVAAARTPDNKSPQASESTSLCLFRLYVQSRAFG